MSSPVRPVLNVIVIVGLVGGVFYLSQHVESVRTQVAQLLHVSPQVLGATTRINPADEIKQNVNEQVDVVKKQALNIRISDILTVIGRAQQVGHDVQDVRTFTQSKIDEFLKQSHSRP